MAKLYDDEGQMYVGHKIYKLNLSRNHIDSVYPHCSLKVRNLLEQAVDLLLRAEALMETGEDR
jgi:hypothetical protein